MSDESHEVWLEKVERALESFRARAEESVHRGESANGARSTRDTKATDDTAQ
jgi:hypothetical protein